MILDVALHLFARPNEMVIASVDLVVTLRACCVCNVGNRLTNSGREAREQMRTWNTRSELVGVFGDQIVVDSILERTQDDDRPCVVDRQTLHRFVRQYILVRCCKKRCRHILVSGYSIYSRNFHSRSRKRFANGLLPHYNYPLSTKNCRAIPN